MFLNKVPFSLGGILTILALSMLAVPVIAQDDAEDTFDVTFHPRYNHNEQIVDVTIETEEVVVKSLLRAAFSYRVIGEDGSATRHTLRATSLVAEDPETREQINPNTAEGRRGRFFGFGVGQGETSDGDPTTLPPQAQDLNRSSVRTEEIQFHVAGGIPSLDPSDDRTSKEVLLRLPMRNNPAKDRQSPKVVSIQRLLPSSQTVTSAFEEARLDPEPFDIRVVLTEAHSEYDSSKSADENAKRLIEVENGTASNLVLGEPFARRGPAGANGSVSNVQRVQTIVPNPGEGFYWHSRTTSGAGEDPGPARGLEHVPRPRYFNLNIALLQEDLVPLPTGADNLYYQYQVRITPHQKSEDFDLKIRVKSFHDSGSPARRTYLPPEFSYSTYLQNGRELLTIPVKGSARDLTAGYKVEIPKDLIIPANGYLVIAKNTAGSEIDTSGQDADRTDDTPRATHRTPAQLLYNVYEASELPNLAAQFLNGVIVDLQSQHPGLVISEVMWGEDVSLPLGANSQYIELYNPGAQYKTVADANHTPDVNEALTLVFYRPNEFSSVPARNADGDLPAGITDRIGTLGATGAYWSPADKGQSGRSGTGESERGDGRTAVAIVPIVSMYRAMDAGEVADGQVAAGWASSEGPKSANFDRLAAGVRHGTPGAATDATTTPADAAAEAKAIADKAKAATEKVRTTGTIPVNGSVYISEVMFAGGGVLPQWIEIANGSKSEEINLSGWTLTIDNAAADTDVSIGASATFTIPDGTTIDPSNQNDSPSTILIVTEVGRNNVDASGQVVNLWRDNEVELILAGVTNRKYTLLSSEAFSITLAPPEPLATKAPAGETVAAKAVRQAAEKKAKAVRVAASDTVGNLGVDGAAAWALPVDEGDGRSSLIRRHVQVSIGPAEPEDGTLAENWVLASDTSFAQPTHIRAASYYGAQSDEGTPGFRAGGALPVELSHFRPARNRETGAVVIAWSTQSELNNAGFFIKRAQQKDGAFTVVNATMVAGAGTTSEKQFYTYTDTTAHPNVVYYYQIEDVSLDGNRQTLTRGIRLKGHVGAAGKATITWADLKTSNE